MLLHVGSPRKPQWPVHPALCRGERDVLHRPAILHDRGLVLLRDPTVLHQLPERPIHLGVQRVRLHTNKLGIPLPRHHMQRLQHMSRGSGRGADLWREPRHHMCGMQCRPKRE